jgi:hypothetical protein
MTAPVATTKVGEQHRVTTAIATAAKRTGVSFDYLMDQARVESGMRPDARATTSSATGLYQFTRQTWLGTVKQHGAEHGLDWAADAISQNNDGSYSVADAAMRSAILDLRTDPQAAAAMAAEFAADNNSYLQSRVGSNLEAVDLYLAHFLGAEGAARFLNAHRDNPEQAAAPLFPAAASANRAIFYSADSAARSLAEIRSNFAAKLGNAPSPTPAVTQAPRKRLHFGSESRASLEMAQMQPMPKRLDLDFARNAYRRLSGEAA